jgi:hypothetical protein
VVINKKWRRKVWKVKGEYHDKKIEEISKNPEEFFPVEGKLVLVKKFPKNYLEKEMGDIIVVSKKSNIFFTTIIELTFGKQRKFKYDLEKLFLSKKNFGDKRKLLFFLRSNGIFPKEGSVLLVSGIALWYSTEFFHEKPEYKSLYKIKSV